MYLWSKRGGLVHITQTVCADPAWSSEFLIPGLQAQSTTMLPPCDLDCLLWHEGLTYSPDIGCLGTVPPLSLQGPALILAVVGLTGWIGLGGEQGSPGARVSLGRRAPKRVKGLPECRQLSSLSWYKPEICTLWASVYPEGPRLPGKGRHFRAACTAWGCCSFPVKVTGGWDWTQH